ncbi:MAG: 16S rRNA (cytosine(1402)-N(4))-methyltransferase RsmH [Paludibacteraceae bacterium]|nr:16S rRNA (cytosine(1402)-N(4))-methyltransferase RsmH [Paludibacteraceae bacterium]
MDAVYHIPALLDPTIDGLNIRPDGTYVDVTFGGGGHSRALLARLGANGRLYSFDRDMDAYANAPSDSRWHFVHSDFRYLRNFMDYYGVRAVDGILADLGVSFHHFDSAGRGFSFRFDGPLDMRMNATGGRTAADIVNTATEEDLARVLYIYGELKNSRQLARRIVAARAKEPVTRTSQLADIVGTDKKVLTLVFQALRIEVNDELGALREMLLSAAELLKSGGRIAVLTYHSLEDRIVKNFLRSGNIDGKTEKDFYGNILTPFTLIEKGLCASEEEVAANPRARSAKLRIAEKK